MSANKHLLVACVAVAILFNTASACVEATIGTWKLESSENFDELLKKLGVNHMLRKVAIAAKPNVEITKDGDEWTLKTISVKSTELKFKINEEFDEVKADGSKAKSTFTIDDCKLVQISDNNGTSYTTVRQVVDGKLKTVATVDDVVCTRVYTKV